MKPQPLVFNWARSLTAEAPLLLSGTDQAALQQVARDITRLTVCVAVTADQQACEQCAMCQLLTRSSHPDITTLDTSTPKGRSMASVRQFLQVISRTPFHGKRVAIILDIDRLSLPALNALLKPLEEPAPSTRYIVTSQHPHKLPATILSRCQRLAISPLESALTATKPDDAFDRLSQDLARYLRDKGPSPALRRAMWRLRDYYQIRHSQGNVKLARQVVVACLFQVDHTLGHTYDIE